MSIMIYADKIDLYSELINAGNILREAFGGDILGIVIGENNVKSIDRIRKIGLSKIITFSANELNEFNPVLYAETIKNTLEEFDVRYVLMNSSYKNKILSGLLSSFMNSALVVDVIRLNVEDNKLLAERPVYSGKASAKEEINADKAILLIKSGVFTPMTEEKTEAEIIEKLIDTSKVSLELLEFSPKVVEEGVKLDEADVVVGGGRGLRKKEDLKLLKELASILGGAWGVTRPLAADYGWAPEWIGISGASINPKLYIATGISGQPQHTSGIRGSKVIVAINMDSEAPIFKFADYGIVGDLYQIIPKLIEKLKEIKEG